VEFTTWAGMLSIVLLAMERVERMTLGGGVEEIFLRER
jgi:hypothetical protein